MLKDDIGMVRKSSQHQVVTRADMQVVNVGGKQGQPESQPEKPRILHMVGQHGTTGLWLLHTPAGYRFKCQW